MKELIGGLAFWEELYEEEKKKNEPLCKACSAQLSRLEQEFEQLCQQYPDWLHLSAEVELRFKNNQEQRNLLTELLDRFVAYQYIANGLANAYLNHSAAQADANDERIDWLMQGIRKKDMELDELNKTLQCFKETYVDLLRHYNQQTELLLTKHKPQPKQP